MTPNRASRSPSSARTAAIDSGASNATHQPVTGNVTVNINRPVRHAAGR